jgi:secreted trypsin-like serine protease
MFFLKFLVTFLLFVQFKPSTTKFTCGKKFISTGLIVGGTYSARGQWPWMAALYMKSTRKYMCGGSLVSKSHVVTAAHCVQQKGTPIKMNSAELSVLLGKYDLSSNNEQESVIKDVKLVVVHPDWRFDDVKYDADISILFLNGDVAFSEYIAPVCLPTARVDAPIDAGTIVSF